MASFRYFHSGAHVDSALELPEWRAFARTGEEACAEPDIAIRLVDHLEPTDPGDHRPVVEGQSLRFTVPDVGTWQVSDGREIAIHPLGPVDSIELRLFTLGSAWGTLGYQRGWAMLHGSAVLGPKGAALFCGPQEAGKSTMAAALAERGLPLIGDDLSRVEPGRADRATRLWPSSTRHKLWDEAIARLGMGEREKVQDYFRAEKFHLEASTGVPTDIPVPLVAIYALSFGDGLAIEKLTGSQAASTVLAETAYRPYFLDAMGRLPEQAVMAARIAAQAKVFRLVRPRDLAALDEVCARVEAHLAEF